MGNSEDSQATSTKEAIDKSAETKRDAAPVVEKKEETKEKMEEKKEEKVKRKKKKKKEEKKETKEPEKIVRSSRGRIRKSVKQFVFEERDNDKDLVVPDGIGTPLGDIQNVADGLSAIKVADPLLRKFHNLIYRGQR